MMKYLIKVAEEKGLIPSDGVSWAKAVKDKLEVMEIYTPEQVMGNIFSLNRQLKERRLKQFHVSTIHELQKIGILRF